VPGVSAVKAVTLSRRGLFFVGLRSGRGRRVQVLYRIWRGRRSVLERRSSTGVSEAGTIGAPHVAGNSVFYSVTLPAAGFRARSVLVRLNLRSGKRSLARPPAPFARRGGIASIVRFRDDFLLETYPESGGNCFPAPASARCTLRRVSRLAFRTPSR
jgi:hypothetical protein